MQDTPITKTQLAVMSAAAGICVANIYYNQPILKDIAHDFGVTESHAGIISVLAQAGYGFGLFFITPLGDKINRRKLILVLQLLLIGTLIGTTFVQNFFWVCAFSLLIGLLSVAAQVILPLAASMDSQNRGRNVGIIITGILVGILSARVFSGLIAEWANWRWVYGISSGMVTLGALTLHFTLPNREQAMFEGNYIQLLGSTLQQFKRFALLRRTALLGGLAFGIFCSFWTTLTFHLSGTPFNYGSDVIGLFGLLAIGGALVAPLVGKLADKGNPARAQVLSMALVLIAIVLVMIAPESVTAFIATVLLLDVGVQAAQVTNIATIYSLDATAHSRINTAYMTSYFIGGSLGTFVGIHCWDAGGWQLVTWQLLLWGVVCLVIAVWGLRKSPGSDV
jgi:predicted MFS family arabinose efflux permease